MSVHQELAGSEKKSFKDLEHAGLQTGMGRREA